MTQTKVKICGLKTPQDVDAVVAAGADFCGLTFVPKSKRFISVAEAAELSQLAAPDLTRVALTVDADDALLDTIMGSVGIDMIQLHGHESPERVAAVKSRYNVPVMKAVGVADAADVAEIARYTPVADWILLDAKPPKDAAVPGGNGLSFDWRLIADVTWQVPWMLAGGLTEDTVGEAIARTGAKVVDLASGVESAPGVKDAEKARRFVAAARA
ncbi:MAG: phosphoribosylanthranilate isomerase [Rhodobacteraceae bacterium]|nr:phosphoribosylanthranilate isomerase [Paracoccaceae bacterium]